MEKIININGRPMRMVANAKIPRTYRNTFGTDMFLDMQKLMQGYNNKVVNDVNFPPEVLTIYENVAWTFLKAGGEDVGANPDEWLENVDGIFSIYEVLPEIVDLWSKSNETTSVPFRETERNR